MVRSNGCTLSQRWSPTMGDCNTGVGDSSVKAPLPLPSANSGVTYPLTQHENPTQFGVYGNLPPSNTHSTAPYSNATGYTAATYHTANTIPQTPPPQTLSPQPRHSHYSSTTTSFEPYNARTSVYNAPPNVYNAIQYAPPTVHPFAV
jgi:hypothetical protein